MLKFTMKDNNPQYLFFTSLLSIVMPLSFMVMNQEHNMVFNFTTISQLVETFNLMMVGLSGWVSALMILISYKYIATSNDNKIYSSKGMTVFTTVVLAVTMASISFFSTNQMVLFYISFEASVFPTLMLIMKWGYQPERLQASYYFIMYTVVGSLPLLLFLLSYMSLTQSQYFTYYGFGLITMKSMVHLISLGGLLAFLAKAPLWGVHLWLPKAHVEAPVSGSMVLAGILLKLGGYGLIKLYLSTVMTNVLWVYMIMALGLWSTVVVSLVCLRQTDMKIMIAYSSVIHMGMMLLGLLSGSTVGFIGAMTMMIVHGFSSPGLFASANYNYENTSSRNLFMQKGFHTLQPFVALLWFILIATNMAAPPFLSLASELMIVTSMMKLGFWTAILTGTATFLSLTYNLFLFSAQQGKVNMNISQFHNMRSYTSLTLTMMSMPCMLSVMSTYLFMV